MVRSRTAQLIFQSFYCAFGIVGILGSFGMYDGRTHTLEEVGQIFGVTRERIRQIENKAIRKLRHPSRAKKIKDFYC